jgi:hypothetical protein
LWEPEGRGLGFAGPAARSGLAARRQQGRKEAASW